MDESQLRLILRELKESNTLMKAAVSELSQIKFELVNERIRGRSPIRNWGAVLRSTDSTYKIKIPEPMQEEMKQEKLRERSLWELFGFYKEEEEKGEYDVGGK